MGEVRATDVVEATDGSWGTIGRYHDNHDYTITHESEGWAWGIER